MKFWKIVLVVLMLLVNLVVAAPSWADKPKLDQNADYLELTQAIEDLLKPIDTQNLSPEEAQQKQEAQQKMANLLQYQKYIVANGEGAGQCRNLTGKTIAVYGPKPKKSDSAYDNALYYLPDGYTTEEHWDCDGVFLPSGIKIAGLNLTGATAAKIVDGTQLVAKTNPDTGTLELNLPPAKLFKPGDINWEIPDLTQVAMNVQYPNAPADN